MRALTPQDREFVRVVVGDTASALVDADIALARRIAALESLFLDRFDDIVRAPDGTIMLVEHKTYPGAPKQSWFKQFLAYVGGTEPEDYTREM